MGRQEISTTGISDDIVKDAMDSRPPRSRSHLYGALFAAAALSVMVILIANPASVTGQQNRPAAEEERFVELAPYMTRLQTLTHKLSLSIDHSNHRLAEFYLYESLEALEDIKTDVPEYRGQPVALLVDRLATPAYKALQAAIDADSAGPTGSETRSPAAFKALIQSCNQCHAVTQHAFIKIPAPSGVNPFLQDFKPDKP